MNLFSNINSVKWQYVIGANLTILVLAGVIATTQPIQTDNRSQAAEPVAAALESIRIDPQNPPELINTDPDWAKVGDAIVVKAKNLGRVPFGTLWIGNTQVPHANIIDWQPDQIVFTVPTDATTAPIILKMKQLKFSTHNSLTIRTTNLQ